MPEICCFLYISFRSLKLHFKNKQDLFQMQSHFPIPNLLHMYLISWSNLSFILSSLLSTRKALAKREEISLRPHIEKTRDSLPVGCGVFLLKQTKEAKQ